MKRQITLFCIVVVMLTGRSQTGVWERGCREDFPKREFGNKDVGKISVRVSFCL